jgi:hypothetical protein
MNYLGLRLGDSAARVLADQEPGVEYIPMMAITPDNIGTTSFAPDGSWTAFPDELAQFKKVWGIS